MLSAGSNINPDILPSYTVATSRQKGSSLARRTYQAGGVYQAGKTRADRWDAAASAYGRFWKDRPSGKKHLASVTLGICRTRSIAERKLAEHIDKLGIGSSS